VNGPTGAEESPPAGAYKRGQGGDQGSPAGAKGQTGDSSEFSTPAPAKTPPTKPTGDAPPFKTEKPVGPPPSQQPGKKAPMKVPEADATEHGQQDFALTMRNAGIGRVENLALQLQDRPTWSYAGSHSERYSSTHHVTAIGRIASTMAPTPQRLKSPTAEWALLPVESRVVRN